MTAPTPEIRAVRRGRSPNCSATGSIVGTALVTLVAASAVVNAFAWRFGRWLAPDDDPGPSGGEPAPPSGPEGDGPTDPDVRVRREGDEAIVAWSDPPALLTVDAATGDAAMARGAREVGGHPAPEHALSAPLEVHVAVTDRCPVACDGCYLDAGPDRTPTEPHADDLAVDLDALADLGVFEVALGGGEVLLRDDTLDLVEAVAARGMVPNLTITGFGLTPERARRLAVHVGQVNVSLDGLDEAGTAVRGWDGTQVAARAVRTLREAGIRVGVNTVLTRASWEGLDALADALVDWGVAEWQWLRFKPAGRGADVYDAMALTPEQTDALWPRLLDLEAHTGMAFRVDCALVPFVVQHAPPAEALAALAVQGCPGGDALWARGADGTWLPCSFAAGLAEPAQGDAHSRWHDDPLLTAWRARSAAPPDPCSTCDYASICRGGCRIVAHHRTGDALAADPECARVRAWQAA